MPFEQKLKISNLINAISKSKIITFERFIYSLGIRHVGIEISNILAKQFIEVNDLINAFSKQDTLSIPNLEGIGDIIKESLIEYFSNKDIISLMNKLIPLLEISYPLINKKGKFESKKIVITGSFEDFTRKEIEDKLVSEGAKIIKVISKNINFILVGNNPGSKLQKAKNMDIEIKYFDFIKNIMND